MLLGVTVVLTLTALGVAGHRLAEYEWPWHRAPAPEPAGHAPPDAAPDALLGPSRTRIRPVAEGATGGVVVPEPAASDGGRDEWPDWSAAIPDGCEDLAAEDIPLGGAFGPEAEAGGVDLEAYLDKLDELALRVSYLVTGQLKTELVPQLRAWLDPSGLAGDQNLNAVMAAGPPDWDEEEIAAKNRYFLELYEQATNQPD